MTNSVINATKSNMKKCTTSFITFPCLSSVPPPLSWSPEFSFSPCLGFLLHSQAFFLPLWSLGFVAKSLSHHINYCSGLSTGLLTFHLPPPQTPARFISFQCPSSPVKDLHYIDISDCLESGLLSLGNSLHVSPQVLYWTLDCAVVGSGASPRVFGSWGYLSMHEWLMWVCYGLTHCPSAVSTMKRSRTRPELDSTLCSSDSVTVSQYIAVCYK